MRLLCPQRQPRGESGCGLGTDGRRRARRGGGTGRVPSRSGNSHAYVRIHWRCQAILLGRPSATRHLQAGSDLYDLVSYFKSRNSGKPLLTTHFRQHQAVNQLVSMNETPVSTDVPVKDSRHHTRFRRMALSSPATLDLGVSWPLWEKPNGTFLKVAPQLSLSGLIRMWSAPGR